jgi:hypothetical protein
VLAVRGLPHSWVALVSPLELFVLMACVGVPRRHILWFAGVGCAAALGLLAVFVATGGRETDWDVHARLWVSPDIIALFLWMAACRDVGISRAWGVLAAWPYVGCLGAWRIVFEVKGRITQPAT